MKNLLIFIICVVLLSGCMSTKPPCPTYADVEDWPAMTIQYDTIVSVQGDTLYHKKPYKLTFLDKAGFVAISAICIWAIQCNKDERE